jgi:uncharacterized protein YigA (DUF484 family)
LTIPKINKLIETLLLLATLKLMNKNTKYIFTSLAAIMAMSNSANAQVSILDSNISEKFDVQLASLAGQSDSSIISKTCGCSACVAQRTTDSIKA